MRCEGDNFTDEPAMPCPRGQKRPFASQPVPVTSAMNLREQALQVLRECDVDRKVALARALGSIEGLGVDQQFTEPAGLPGRPQRPALVPHTRLKRGSLGTPQGRA